jgi:putative MATE family efflux protein
MIKEEQTGIVEIEEVQAKEAQAEDVLTKAELRKSIIAFTWPCLAELMLVSLISVVNQAMVGHLGAYAISAVGLTNQPVLVSVAVFQAFNVGATALVARFIGAKEYDNAKLVVIQTLVVSVISGIVLFIIGYSLSNWIVIKMGANEDTLYYADLYMKYMSLGIIFQAIPTAVSSLLRGAGDTKSPMRYNIISNIVNVTAGYVLIYGFWFIPGMGLEGAAIATTLAKFTACILSIFAIFKSHLPVAVSLRDKFRLDFTMLKRIMNIGVAAAGEQLAMRVGFIIYTKIVADLGTVPFAAHQVVISINGLSFNFGQALGMSATSFMGRYLGSKKPDTAEAYCRELRRIAMIVSIFISACFLFEGQIIARFFTTEVPVIVLTAYLLKILVLMVPAQNSQLVISGGLRGAGDTMWTLFSTTAGVLLVRVPLVVILIKVFHYGVGAAWVAAVIDQYVRSVVVYFRFRDGKWKQVKV